LRLEVIALGGDAIRARRVVAGGTFHARGVVDRQGNAFLAAFSAPPMPERPGEARSSAGTLRMT
jgi:hypothetical protein